MPLFVLIGRDTKGSAPLRKTHRAAHLAKLQQLEAQRRLRHAGPMLSEHGEPVGSVVIFEAPDLASAQRLAATDPYVIEGVFESFEVYETLAVFPKPNGNI